MKLTRIISLFALLGALFAISASASAQPRNFVAHLSGDDEVPAVDTQAQGQVKLQLSRDGAALDFKLIVANIEVLSRHTSTVRRRA